MDGMVECIFVVICTFIRYGVFFVELRVYMSNLERKLGKYAIKNLTLYLIGGYIIGYVIEMIGNLRGMDFISWITLDPWKIMHGQVWRLISWVLILPSYYSGFTGLMFLLLMMYCCFSIGTVLEKTWGSFKYNVYIFGGILFTVIGAFAALGIACLAHNHFGANVSDFILLYEDGGILPWGTFSTFFINMSIYLGFALTYPDNMVRFMFFIPIKMKWLGLVDALYFAYYYYVGISNMVKGWSFSFHHVAYDYLYYSYGVFTVVAVTSAVINILIFWLVNLKRFNPAQAARRAKFMHEYNSGARKAASSSASSKSFYSQGASGNNMRMRGNITKHKCAVCGQSEQDNPELEFRFCSKCNGAYEYCQNHLFTHVHKI